MKLQDQVCTKEQAQRLKELGVAQTAIFAWTEIPQLIYYRKSQAWPAISTLIEWEAAFTVAELGRAIGSGTFAAQKFHDAVMSKINASHSMTIATSPQFVASFLIAAIEAGVVKVEGVNQRLKQ